MHYPRAGEDWDPDVHSVKNTPKRTFFHLHPLRGWVSQSVSEVMHWTALVEVLLRTESSCKRSTATAHFSQQ